MNIPCSTNNEQVKVLSSAKFHTVQVWLDDGFTWTANISPRMSEDEIVYYFLGKYFYNRPYPQESLDRCVAVQILEFAGE